MKPDDPIVQITDVEWRQEFLKFIISAVPTDNFGVLANTNVAFQYGLSSRVNYEESILKELQHQRRVKAFVGVMDSDIRSDLPGYMATQQPTLKLTTYLKENSKVAKAIEDFQKLESRRQNMWDARIASFIDKAIDPAMMLTSRFQRVRRLWTQEPESLDDLPLHLVLSEKRAEFQAFIATGIASDEFTEFINHDIACQRAIAFQAHYEENLLFLTAFYRRLKKIAGTLKPRWQAEFLAYFATGFISTEFEEAQKANQELADNLGEFISKESLLAREYAAKAKETATNRSFDQATILTDRIFNIRQAWFNIELNP